MKKVSKEEFDAFIAAYPRKLEFDVNRTGEPPVASYNDPTLGDWPKSVVASYFIFDPTDGYYAGQEPEWKVRS